MGGLLEIVDDALYHSIDLMPESGTRQDVDRAVRKAISDEGRRVKLESVLATFASGVGYDSKKADWWGGLRAKIPEELLPKRLILKAGDRIPDIYSGWGITLVSQAFREAIEEFDKDIHQFVPVEIVLADGRPYPHQQFFYFQCRQALNTVDPDSHPTIKESVKPERARPENLSGVLIYRRTEGFSVFADRMNGAGIWQEMRSSSYLFMSDALIARLKDKGCNGWDIRPHFNEV